MTGKKDFKIGAIVYARMDSRRLPGKVLMKLGYHNHIMDYCVDALKHLEPVKTIIATSDRAVDLPLEDYALKRKLNHFRGELDDVAHRTIACCSQFDLDYFIRVNGDSPFINIQLIKAGLELIMNHNFDLVSNLIHRSYPYGVSCEIIKVKTFKNYYSRFSELEREHITSFFYKNLKEIKFAELPVLPVD